VVWVQRIIWLVLAIFSLSVLWVVFSGGVVDDREAPAPASTASTARGSMAYDRFLPGGREAPDGARP
jgi:hypothetical protein